MTGIAITAGLIISSLIVTALIITFGGVFATEKMRDANQGFYLFGFIAITAGVYYLIKGFVS